MLFVLVPPVQKVLQRFSKFCLIRPNFFDLNFSTRLAHLLSFAGLFLFIVMFFSADKWGCRCVKWCVMCGKYDYPCVLPGGRCLWRSPSSEVGLIGCFSLLAKMVDWLVERLWCSGLICREMKGGLCQRCQLVTWDFTRDRWQVKVVTIPCTSLLFHYLNNVIESR